MTLATNRRRGASAELELLDHLIAQGHDAVRMHLTGAHDQGDVIVFHGNSSVTVYEVKSVRNLDIPKALRELAAEVANTERARPGITVKGRLAVRLFGGHWAMIEPWP